MKRKPRKTDSAMVREEAVHEYRAREQMSTALREGTVVSAANFKANCLSLMDEVRETGVEFVITKHNQPVARLVPVVEKATSRFIGRGAQVLTVKGDIVSPTAPDWEEGADI